MEMETNEPSVTQDPKTVILRVLSKPTQSGKVRLCQVWFSMWASPQWRKLIYPSADLEWFRSFWIRKGKTVLVIQFKPNRKNTNHVNNNHTSGRRKLSP